MFFEPISWKLIAGCAWAALMLVFYGWAFLQTRADPFDEDDDDNDPVSGWR